MTSGFIAYFGKLQYGRYSVEYPIYGDSERSEESTPIFRRSRPAAR